MGFGLVIGFIEHLQMETTSNYNALANSCTPLLTTTHTKYSQSVFTSRFLVTDTSNVLCLRPYWLANVPQLTHCQSQSQNYFTTGGLQLISSSWRQAP
jgi:hypothetical protein